MLLDSAEMSWLARIMIGYFVFAVLGGVAWLFWSGIKEIKNDLRSRGRLHEWLLEEIKDNLGAVKHDVQAHTAARHPRNISETPISLPPPTVNAGEEPPHAR
jgi:hypothetical protein